MVRQSASSKAAKQATDLKADPGYADLYIPRKSGDPTGQSQIVNEAASGLTAEVSGEQAAEAVAATTDTQVGGVARPIKLGDKTKFPGVSNVNGLQTGTGAPFKPMPEMDFDAYMMGLFEQFRDPIILEYFQQKNAAPQVVDAKKQYRYANKLKESDAV